MPLMGVIDPQLRSLEEKKTWNNGEVYGKQKATDQLRIQLVAGQQCTNGQTNVPQINLI